MVSGFQKHTTYDGKDTTKAMHCLDVREALPFLTYEEAEQAYKKYGGGWWHCVLNTGRE
jgi:hypothetical protein